MIRDWLESVRPFTKAAAMNLTPVLRHALLALLLLGASAAPLGAQNILYTNLDGKFLAVRRAQGNRPCVQIDGREKIADGNRYVLQKTPEYLPMFISVRNLEVKSEHLNLNGSSLNHEFTLRAWLETPYFLDDVFLVLELDTDSAGKVLFLQEIGQLEARLPRLLSVRVQLASGLGSGKYQLHLFSGGREVLHSNIPAQKRDAAVDQMTARRITGVEDAPPQPLIGPGPEYPPALLKAKTSGQAVISIRIGANGQVYDPKVKSATDPAFGESALTAVRLWRFLPKVREGRPQEARVDVPFNFAPPVKPAKKS